MNSKFASYIISLLAAFNTLISFIRTITETIYALSNNQPLNIFEMCLSISSVVFSLLILIIFSYHNKWYEDAYKLMLILAKNNKLHPIRALIMILESRKKLGDYNFNISRATFCYQITPSHSTSRTHDVTYTLQLEIRLSWLEKHFLSYQISRNRLPSLKYYAICENSKPNLEYIKVENDILENTILVPAPLSGESGDTSEEFSGLYVFNNLQIPSNLLHRGQIKLEIKYTVPNQIISGAQQYTFVIIPINYGRKIHDLDISIMGNLPSKPKLQVYSPTVPTYDERHVPQFECPKSGHYHSYLNHPSNKSVYIAQIDLPTPEK